MSDRRTVDELTIEELEQLLIVRRRELRTERMRRLMSLPPLAIALLLWLVYHGLKTYLSLIHPTSVSRAVREL